MPNNLWPIAPPTETQKAIVWSGQREREREGLLPPAPLHTTHADDDEVRDTNGTETRPEQEGKKQEFSLQPPRTRTGREGSC